MSYYAPIGSPDYDGDTDERITPEDAAAELIAAGYDVEDVSPSGLVIHVGEHVIYVYEDEDCYAGWQVSEPARPYAQHLGCVWRHSAAEVVEDFRYAVRTVPV